MWELNARIVENVFDVVAEARVPKFICPVCEFEERDGD